MAYTDAALETETGRGCLGWDFAPHVAPEQVAALKPRTHCLVPANPDPDLPSGVEEASSAGTETPRCGPLRPSLAKPGCVAEAVEHIGLDFRIGLPVVMELQGLE